MDWKGVRTSAVGPGSCIKIERLQLQVNTHNNYNWLPIKFRIDYELVTLACQVSVSHL